MDAIISTIGNFLCENFLVALLLLAGIYFTIRIKGAQFTMLGESIRVLKESPSNKEGISAMQTLMLTTGARVGTGNIVGVSSAICIGGPGALFWMWAMTALGGATAFIENTLAQIYKHKSKEGDKDGNSYGGPAFYMQDALHMRWLGVIFSIFVFLTYAVGFNMVCSYNLVDAFSFYTGGHDAFYSTPVPYIIAAVVSVIVCISIFGGGKRLAKVNSFLTPIMSTVFLVSSILIIILNVKRLPSVFVAIFSQAFDFKAIFGGFTGSCLMQGIKRGLFSNEAGVGSSPNAAASADTSHPAKQGLVQVLSVFIDTLVICTATGLLCLSSGIEPTEEIAGVAYAQQAAGATLGVFGNYVITFSVVLFAFTSMVGNLSYCNATWKFIFKNNAPQWATVAYRIFGVLIIFLGAVLKASTVWNLADIFMACACIINIPTIVILGNQAIAALKDYRDQKAEGKDPVFHAKTIGVSGTDFWN